jgi:hypothetical protein
MNGTTLLGLIIAAAFVVLFVLALQAQFLR